VAAFKVFYGPRHSFSFIRNLKHFIVNLSKFARSWLKKAIFGYQEHLLKLLQLILFCLLMDLSLTCLLYMIFGHIITCFEATHKLIIKSILKPNFFYEIVFGSLIVNNLFIDKFKTFFSDFQIGETYDMREKALNRCVLQTQEKLTSAKATASSPEIRPLQLAVSFFLFFLK